MMLLEILAKAAGVPVATIIAVLRAGAEKVPDAAAALEDMIAKLSAPLSPENLAAVGAAALGEIQNIAQGKIDPRDHPSDLG